MATPDEEGLKGNKKGRPVWSFVKNASLAITIFLFFFTIVLVLDAYKFVSVRVSRMWSCILQSDEGRRRHIYFIALVLFAIALTYLFPPMRTLLHMKR